MGILAQIELDYDYEIVDDFITHYGIMCESIETLAINLGEQKYYKNNVNELFRICHNIKSAAGFVKLDPIVKLASLTEEVLEEARYLQGPASDEFIDWLLLISDQFTIYRTDVEEDREHFSLLEPLIIRLPTVLEK